MNLTRMHAWWLAFPAAVVIAGGGTALGLSGAGHPAAGRPEPAVQPRTGRPAPTPVPSRSGAAPAPTPVPSRSGAAPVPAPVPTSSGRA
jgi:hypothetical protein